jgi:hypothetical protein
MSNEHTQRTHDTNEIRRWAEARQGWPATVHGTGKGGEAGVLRIGFREDEDLDEIGWDEFSAKFEDEKLDFIYQERTADGGESRFFKFVERE